MPFGGFHGLDLVVVLAIALLIFGPKKLPEMGASIGKSIKEFKKGMAELTEPKAEKPAAYETVAAETPVANYMATEPLATDYTIAEPVSEIYEKPAGIESEVKESEVNAQ